MRLCPTSCTVQHSHVVVYCLIALRILTESQDLFAATAGAVECFGFTSQKGCTLCKRCLMSSWANCSPAGQGLHSPDPFLFVVGGWLMGLPPYPGHMEKDIDILSNVLGVRPLYTANYVP